MNWRWLIIIAGTMLGIRAAFLVVAWYLGRLTEAAIAVGWPV